VNVNTCYILVMMIWELLYLFNWLIEIICDYNIDRKWIYVFIWCAILILCMSSYLLYVEHILYRPVAFWSPTSSWCRRAGRGQLVNASSRGRHGAYSPFYTLILESCLERIWFRLLGILFMFSDLCWGTFEFTVMVYLRFEIMTLCFFEVLFWLWWSMHVLD